jgi:hypothetical protein
MQFASRKSFLLVAELELEYVLSLLQYPFSSIPLQIFLLSQSPHVTVGQGRIAEELVP